MSNKYYEAGQHRAERVQDLFAAVAPRYDLINDLQSFGLHRWWKRRVIRLADPQPGERALDLCCGTGDVAFALSRRGCDVIGLDFSEPMLAVARLRITQSAAPRFLQGDAQSLPFPDNSFDLVTVSYGLRNLSDWKKGLSEMVRVVRPGGRLLVLDFGKPDNQAWRGLYFFYLKWFVPIFGKIFCGDSQTHAYIMESLNHYPAQRGVAAGMNELGCSAVKIVNLMGGVMTINYGKK